MDTIFHYPLELMSLLINAIPRICRTKNDVLLFFKGAGVDSALTNDLAIQLKKDKDSIKKYDIARTVLSRLNEKGDATPERATRNIKAHYRDGGFLNLLA
jgi:restriction system protein